VRAAHDPPGRQRKSRTGTGAGPGGGRRGETGLGGVNTALPNRLVRATIEQAASSPGWAPIGVESRARSPMRQPVASRIDLLLSPPAAAADPRPIYLEVKNTNWEPGSGPSSPDTVTERARSI